MVRVDRLYLGPMSAPDKLGSDQIMVHRLKLGRELLPAPVFAPLNAPFWGRPVVFLLGVCLYKEHHQNRKDTQANHDQNRKTLIRSMSQ
jgi:hypothetical protein